MSEPFFEPESDESSSASSHEGLPKATVISALAAIVFVVAATFFGMQWSGARNQAATLETEIANISEREAELTTELDALQAEYRELQGRTDILANGSFEICNESSSEVTVSRLAATYVNADGGFETFNSEPYGSRLWQIVPGERKSLTFEQGDVAWDGSVVYYAAELRGPDGQTYPFAGMWPPNAAGCFRWTD